MNEISAFQFFIELYAVFGFGFGTLLVALSMKYGFGDKKPLIFLIASVFIAWTIIIEMGWK